MSACAQARRRIVAPPLLAIEVVNIIRQRMIREGLGLGDTRRLIDRFLAFPVTLRTSPALHERALTLAPEYNLPAVYDAHYVALAQQLGCRLWTDDRRLLRNLGGQLNFIRWIGDYAASEPL